MALWRILSPLAILLAIADNTPFAIPLYAQLQGSRAPDSDVRELLRQYSAAFESLNPSAVKKVQPSANAENLKKAFTDMRTLEVTIDDIKILSTEGTTVRVSCRVTQALTPKVGTRRVVAVTRVMRLRKQDGNWIIDAFER